MKMEIIREFLGYISTTKEVNYNGKEYLAETDNPGAMLAINGTLIIKDNNRTFTREEVDFITLIIEADGN